MCVVQTRRFWDSLYWTSLRICVLKKQFETNKRAIFTSSCIQIDFVGERSKTKKKTDDEQCDVHRRCKCTRQTVSHDHCTHLTCLHARAFALCPPLFEFSSFAFLLPLSFSLSLSLSLSGYASAVVEVCRECLLRFAFPPFLFYEVAPPSFCIFHLGKAPVDWTLPR